MRPLEKAQKERRKMTPWEIEEESRLALNDWYAERIDRWIKDYWK